MAEPTAHTEVPGGTEHAPPTALGIFTAPTVVALAMTVVIILLIWKKVPAAIGKSLDKKIAAIREQLAEAEALRQDAEALTAEYEAKAKAADQEAAAMVERARHEAEAIVAKAEADTSDVIARREKMAQDKIGAAERSAVADLRSKAARAAADAAQGLIRSNYSADADRALVDQSICAN